MLKCGGIATIETYGFNLGEDQVGWGMGDRVRRDFVRNHRDLRFQTRGSSGWVQHVAIASANIKTCGLNLGEDQVGYSTV